MLALGKLRLASQCAPTYCRAMAMMSRKKCPAYVVGVGMTKVITDCLAALTHATLHLKDDRFEANVQKSSRSLENGLGPKLDSYTCSWLIQHQVVCLTYYAWPSLHYSCSGEKELDVLLNEVNLARKSFTISESLKIPVRPREVAQHCTSVFISFVASPLCSPPTHFMRVLPIIQRQLSIQYCQSKHPYTCTTTAGNLRSLEQNFFTSHQNSFLKGMERKYLHCGSMINTCEIEVFDENV